jgi:RNA polymerase sigma-70 factor (sigma-E family)
VVVQGSPPSFEDFVAVRLTALLRQATVLAGDPHQAEDVVQDVLIKAQRNWARICRLEVPESYLRRMIINELVSTRRRLTARLRRERSALPEPASDRTEQVVQRDALVQLIRELPARQRIVIALRYFEDMSDQSIAVLLGCSPSTVRSQAARALARLRNHAGLADGTEPEPSRRDR